MSLPIIETERLFLRPVRMEDLDDFHAYAKVPGVGEMAGWPAHPDLATSEAILSDMVKGIGTKSKVFALVYKPDRKMIGTLGYEPVSKGYQGRFCLSDGVEVGYVLSKDYWGRGLMPEAVKGVLPYLFQTEKAKMVYLAIAPNNRQSVRVAEKTGFRFLGLKNQPTQTVWGSVYQAIYGMSKAEFEADWKEGVYR